MSEVKYIAQVSDFDMNQKRNLFGLLWYFKNLYFNYKNKTVLQTIKIK